MGFILQGLPPAAIGPPLRGHALLSLPGRDAPPRRETSLAGPATGPSSRDESVLTPEPQGLRPSIPSWSSPHQSVLPFDLALALIAAPPLSSLDGLTSLPVRVSGYRGANEWTGPSQGHQLSRGFRPYDVHSAPFADPQGGLMVSPHAFPRRSGTPRSMPIGYDATADPGPAARRRRPSVCNR
jgi:hypothetical protein